MKDAIAPHLRIWYSGYCTPWCCCYIKLFDYSYHRWRNKTRCRVEGSVDYGVTHLTTLAQEQNQKLLMHCHVHGSLVYNVFVLK